MRSAAVSALNPQTQTCALAQTLTPKNSKAVKPELYLRGSARCHSSALHELRQAGLTLAFGVKRPAFTKVLLLQGSLIWVWGLGQVFLVTSSSQVGWRASLSMCRHLRMRSVPLYIIIVLLGYRVLGV